MFHNIRSSFFIAIMCCLTQLKLGASCCNSALSSLKELNSKEECSWEPYTHQFTLYNNDIKIFWKCLYIPISYLQATSVDIGWHDLGTLHSLYDSNIPAYSKIFLIALTGGLVSASGVHFGIKELSSTEFGLCMASIGILFAIVWIQKYGIKSRKLRSLFSTSLNSYYKSDPTLLEVKNKYGSKIIIRNPRNNNRYYTFKTDHHKDVH